MYQTTTTPSQRMMNQQDRRSLGSVYLVTLITVAAIVSMVLIGVNLRSASNTQSSFVEQIAKTSSGAIGATEYALQFIENDPNWNTTAQKGEPFPEFSIDDMRYSGSVVDSGDDKIPTEDTDSYRITINATNGTVSESYSIDAVYTTANYSSFLDGFHALHYWPLNETRGTATSTEQIGIADGTYLDPSIPGSGSNDEGGISPVFADNTDHIEIPKFDELAYDAEGTVSMWVKTPDAPSYSAKGLIGLRATTSTSGGGTACLSLLITDTVISLYLDDDEAYSVYNHVISSSGAIKNGIWSHVAFSWGGNGIFIYVDGVKVAENTSNVDAVWTYSGKWAPTFTIGSGLFILPNLVFEVGFNGSIAHVAYLKNQLKDDEISELAAVKPDLTALSIVDGSWVKVYE